MSRTTARLNTMPAVTTAWAMRQAKNTEALGASNVPMVARRKMANAPSTTGLRPKRSLIGPMTTCNTADRAR